MRGFVFRLVPPRDDFALTMSEDERATMMAHVAYWSTLAKEGRALAFGPVDDRRGSYGIGVILADGQAEAEALRDADPAMLSPHGFRTEIAPMLQLVTPNGSYDAVTG